MHVLSPRSQLTPIDDQQVTGTIWGDTKKSSTAPVQIGLGSEAVELHLQTMAQA